jgi:hypothetical protein
LDVYAATPIDVAILFGPDGKMVRVQQVTFHKINVRGVNKYENE